MKIADEVNRNANQFMTDFSEYIECIFDTVEHYLVDLEKSRLGMSYIPDKFELPRTEMICASIDKADTFTKLDQKQFADSIIYTEVYTDTKIKNERKRDYIFRFICNGATISVKTRFIVYNTVQMYFGLKHPSSDVAIIPQDTFRFNSYFTMNTKFTDCEFQIQNIIWTALMLKDIEVLSDLLMFVPESGKVLTSVAQTIFSLEDDAAIPVKIRVHETIDKLRNRYGMSQPINRCICGYHEE